MTERNPPVWMQSGTYNAVDDRLVTGLLADRDRGPLGDGNAILGGVVPGFGQLAVTAPGTTMQVTVSTGTVIVPAPSVTPPGAYVCYNEGDKTLTLAITGANPRIDIVYAEVEDEVTGGDESTWRLGVQQGAESASPVNPVLAPGRFPLAAIRVVPASQNGGVNKVTGAQITDLRLMLASIGGTHVTKNGLPNPPHAPGRLLYNQDAKQLYVSDGTTWDYYLTYQGWMSVLASVRPTHAATENSTIPTGAASTNTWTATPPKYTGGGNIVAGAVTLRSPSGLFKVSLSSHGRVSSTAGNGNLGIRVLQGGTTLQAPSGGWQCISFYNTVWEHHGASFLAGWFPANTDLTFRLEYNRSGATANIAYFLNSYFMVEPVL